MIFSSQVNDFLIHGFSVAIYPSNYPAMVPTNYPAKSFNCTSEVFALWQTK